MTTRFDARANGIRSGYDTPDYSTQFSIPSCGIEDVDVAIFNLFDKEIPLQVNTGDGVEKVKIIFAAGEKWAIIKKKKEIRNRQGRLILPLITVGRTSITQDAAKDIAGRGVNQQTGEMRITRRLDGTDRTQQNLTNRLFLKNQNSTAVLIPTNGQVATRRTIGSSINDPNIRDGALLMPPDRRENIWETITIPTPQFFSAHYEITVWTQYMMHMNQLLEMLIAAQLPQGNAYKISNPNNSSYWFVATVDNNEYAPENNFDDMNESDRIIKYTFNMTVPGYIIATEVPGAPVPIRKYVSAAAVDFKSVDVGVGSGLDVTSNVESDKDPWLGADDPTLPSENDVNSNFVAPSVRRDGYRLLDRKDDVSSNDPALRSFKRGVTPDRYVKVPVMIDGKVTYRYVKVTSYNSRSGEATIPMNFSGMPIVVTND